MKKMGILMLVFFSAIFAEEKELDTDVRKYHQPMEEKVFEIEDEELQSEKVHEAFLMGKKRIEDLKKNEKILLDMETKQGMDRSKEIEELDRKYEKILEEYKKNLDEKEIILLENRYYEEQLKRLEKVEKGLTK